MMLCLTRLKVDSIDRPTLFQVLNFTFVFLKRNKMARMKYTDSHLFGYFLEFDSGAAWDEPSVLRSIFAVQEVLMLPGFIRLADYMVVEGLMLLAVGTGEIPPLTMHEPVR
jgi:hypothetical protein